MEFVGDIARKRGEPGLLAVEAAKGSRALEIGRDCGLFNVPKIVSFDAEAGVLEFERLRDLATLLDLAVRKDTRLPGLLTKAGQALAVIHEELMLPEEMRCELPSPWMGSSAENVFIHGDFACINVCFHEPSGQLVILDWSAAPMVGRTPTFGGRYFDIILFVSSLFQGAPCRRVFSWDAPEMAEAFLEGYRRVWAAHPNSVSGQCPPCNLGKYSSEMFRLQRPNIRRASKQRRPLSALVLTACQILMYARFSWFLRKCGH